MSLLRAIIIGIIQGLTEFLPVSSTAHIRIVPALLRWEDPGAAFTAVIQLGTMAAVVIYFGKDLWNMTLAWFGSLPVVVQGLRGAPAPIAAPVDAHESLEEAGVGRAGPRPAHLKRTAPASPAPPDDRPGLGGRLAATFRALSLDARLMWMVLLGTIPVGILGLLFKDQIEGPFRDLRLIAASLIVFGLVLGAADQVGKKRRTVADMNAVDGALIGLWQSLALIPGVSRSGSTMTGGLFRGLNREAAARYSFLLSVPAVVLSGAFELRHAFTGHLPLAATLVATVVSFVVGYASIAGMLSFLRTRSNWWFTGYRIVAGVLLLLAIAFNVIPRELVGG